MIRTLSDSTARLDVRLSATDLVAAGTLLGSRPTALSPLDPGAHPQVVDDRVRSRLAAAGVIVDGQLSASARRALDALSRTQATVRLLMDGPGAAVDVALYAAADRQIALVAGRDSVRLRDPAGTEALVATIWHHFAASSVTPGDLDVTLPDASALTLLAVVDAAREARLAALAGAAGVSGDVDSRAISRRLASDDDRPSLARTVSDMLGARPADADAIELAVTDLDRRGLLARADGKFALAEPVRPIARGFAAIERILRVHAAHLADSGGLALVEIAAIQGNGAGVLMVERSAAAHVHLVATSTNALIETVASLIQKVETLPPPSSGAEAPPAQARVTRLFCGACGTPARDGAKFCEECGKSLAAHS